MPQFLADIICEQPLSKYYIGTPVLNINFSLCRTMFSGNIWEKKFKCPIFYTVRAFDPIQKQRARPNCQLLSSTICSDVLLLYLVFINHFWLGAAGVSNS